MTGAMILDPVVARGIAKDLVEMQLVKVLARALAQQHVPAIANKHARILVKQVVLLVAFLKRKDIFNRIIGFVINKCVFYKNYIVIINATLTGFDDMD